MNMIRSTLLAGCMGLAVMTGLTAPALAQKTTLTVGLASADTGVPGRIKGRSDSEIRKNQFMERSRSVGSLCL
jgi:hypothetical protein